VGGRKLRTIKEGPGGSMRIRGGENRVTVEIRHGDSGNQLDYYGRLSNSVMGEADGEGSPLEKEKGGPQLIMAGNGPGLKWDGGNDSTFENVMTCRTPSLPGDFRFRQKISEREKKKEHEKIDGGNGFYANERVKKGESKKRRSTGKS